YFFFFKQKTAYEISRDWSSDVCSSDLLLHRLHQADVPLLDQVEELEAAVGVLLGDRDHQPEVGDDQLLLGLLAQALALADLADRSEERRVGKECGSRWGPFQ